MTASPPPRRRRLWSLPNLLCLLRLALSPVLLALAWHGRGGLFLIVLAAALLSDAADGFIARRFDQRTEIGPRLDSLADASVYLTLPLACWWLWPETLRREAGYVLAVLLSVVVPPALGWLKFGALTSYHTWLVKTAAVLTPAASVLMLLDGPAWPFRVATLLCLAAALEQIAITRLLDRPRHDVGTLWHVAGSPRPGCHRPPD